MNKLLALALLCTISGAVSAGLAEPIDISTVTVPKVGDQIVSMKASKLISGSEAGKIRVTGWTMVNGEKLPFSVQLLEDGKTVDTTWGNNGFSIGFYKSSGGARVRELPKID